jgi:hypothetical protein
MQTAVVKFASDFCVFREEILRARYYPEKYRFVDWYLPGVENIADHETIGPRKFFMLAERKKGRKKKGERKKRKKEKRKERKRIERKRVTEPISSHFVQGQTLGVGGASKIISERTLIAECSFICRQPCSTPFGPLLALYRTTALVPKFAICIIPLPP